MNTLEELNDYSNEKIITEDERAFFISYSDDQPSNVNLSLDEGEIHQVPFTVDIDNMYSLSNCVVTVVLDNDGSTLFPGFSIDNYTQDDDYTWHFTLATFDQWPPAANVNQPFNSSGFGYTVYWSHPTYANVNGYSWHVTVDVNDLSEWSLGIEPVYFGQFQEWSGNVSTFPPVAQSPAPYITDVENPNTTTYTVEIYPSDANALANISSSGTGNATVDWNITTPNTYTMTGDKDGINSHLANLRVWTANGWVTDFEVYYEQLGLGSFVSTRLQNWIYSQELDYWFMPTSPVNYDEDIAVSPVPGYPQIADLSESNASSYTVEIYASDSNAIANISSIGASAASTDWSISNTFAYTIVGDKDDVNDHLTNLTVTPGVDYAVDFTLYYKVTDAGNVATETSQDWQIDALNTETSNLGIDRTYNENAINLVYSSNVPQIIEDLGPGPFYSIYLTLGANIGEIHYVGNSTGWFSALREYRFTGTRDECNAMLGNIQFQPWINTHVNTTLQFRQFRDGTLQTDDTVNYNYIAGPNANPTFYSYGYTDGAEHSFSFTNANCIAYNFDVVVCGGGGAGALSWAYNSSPVIFVAGGGGGAGGLVYLQNTNIFTNAANGVTSGNLTFNYLVGAGGNAIGSNTYTSGNASYLLTNDFINTDPRYFELRAAGGGKGGWRFDLASPSNVPPDNGGSGGGGAVYKNGTFSVGQTGGANVVLGFPTTHPGVGNPGGDGDGGLANANIGSAGGGGATAAGNTDVGGGEGEGTLIPFSANLSSGGGNTTPYTYCGGGRRGRVGQGDYTPQRTGLPSGNLYGWGGDGGCDLVWNTGGSVYGKDGADGVIVIKRYWPYQGPT